MQTETDIKELLLAHLKRYPQMRAADAVKLLYQNEFAGGHLVGDKAKSLDRLKREYEALKSVPSQTGEEAFEDIGNGLCRMNLKRSGALG